MSANKTNDIVIYNDDDDDIYESLNRKIFRQDMLQEGMTRYRNAIKEFLNRCRILRDALSQSGLKYAGFLDLCFT